MNEFPPFTREQIEQVYKDGSFLADLNGQIEVQIPQKEKICCVNAWGDRKPRATYAIAWDGFGAGCSTKCAMATNPANVRKLFGAPVVERKDCSKWPTIIGHFDVTGSVHIILKVDSCVCGAEYPEGLHVKFHGK